MNTNTKWDSYAAWRVFGFIIPQFGLEDLASHSLHILLRVVPGDGGKNQQALAN